MYPLSITSSFHIKFIAFCLILDLIVPKSIADFLPTAFGPFQLGCYTRDENLCRSQDLFPLCGCTPTFQLAL